MRTGLIFVTLLASTVLASSAHAQETPAGTITNLSGPLSAKHQDGALRVLGIDSPVRSGDTLYTEKDTYARVKFADGGEITLRPNTQLQIEKFDLAPNKPDDGNAFFRLVKGGLRAISGLIGKTHRDGYRMNTPTATIGIRGTQFSLLFCQDDCGNIKTAGGGTPDNGLHIDVTEGAVVATNPAGSAQFKAGEAGIVRGTTTPPLPVPPENAVKIPTGTQADRVRSGGATGREQECVVQ